MDTGKAVGADLMGIMSHIAAALLACVVEAQCPHCIVAQPLTSALQSSSSPVPVSSLGFLLPHISCELDWPVRRHLSPFLPNHTPSPHLLPVGFGTLARLICDLFVPTDRASEVLCSWVFGHRNSMKTV